jgi:hypothetical protein
MTQDSDDAGGLAPLKIVFEAAEMAALDDWIAVQDIPFTRSEAVRAIVAATLQLMQARA